MQILRTFVYALMKIHLFLTMNLNFGVICLFQYIRFSMHFFQFDWYWTQKIAIEKPNQFVVIFSDIYYMQKCKADIEVEVANCLLLWKKSCQNLIDGLNKSQRGKRTKCQIKGITLYVAVNETFTWNMPPKTNPSLPFSKSHSISQF